MILARLHLTCPLRNAPIRISLLLPPLGMFDTSDSILLPCFPPIFTWLALFEMRQFVSHCDTSTRYEISTLQTLTHGRPRLS